jgi:exosome complex component RRP45
VVLLDPTKIEERMAHGLVSVALNVQREICVLNKLGQFYCSFIYVFIYASNSGGTPLDPTELMSIVRIACERVKAMDGLVTKVLQKDWEGRKRVVEVI